MREHVGNRRQDGGALSRFVHEGHGHADRSKAALKPDNRALAEGRTIFAKSVTTPQPGERVLISGHNNGKLGAVVAKGAWAGMPMFHLSLEERATCPRSCAQWDTCYGNAMPFAKRRKYGPELMYALRENLAQLQAEHPAGFVVRLHVLGDFPDDAYVGMWAHWLSIFPALRVWGYTAHDPARATGTAIKRVGMGYPDRWRIRFSVDASVPDSPMQATVLWRQPEGHRVPEGLVCPLQLGKTRTCGTCALCWSPAAANQRIVFVGHGMNPSSAPRGPRKPKPQEPVMHAEPARATPPAAPLPMTITIRHEVHLSPETVAALGQLAQAVADMVVKAFTPIVMPDLTQAPQPAQAPRPVDRAFPLPPLLREGHPEQPDDPEKRVGPVSDAALLDDQPAVDHSRHAWPTPRSAPEPTWNGERDAVIRRRYPGGDSIKEIRDECNKIPGPWIKDTSLVYARANSLGLRREIVAEDGTPFPGAPPRQTVTWQTVLDYALSEGINIGTEHTKAFVLRKVNECRKAKSEGVFVMFGDWGPNEPWPPRQPPAPQPVPEPAIPAPPAPQPLGRAEALARVAMGSVGEFHTAGWPEIRAWAQRHAPMVAGAALPTINAARKAKGLKPYQLNVGAPMVERHKQDLDRSMTTGAP